VSTYDPKSVQITIGGVPMGKSTAAIIGTSPRVPALATRADLKAAGLGFIGEQAARLMDDFATTKYRDDAAPPMRAGADGTAFARMFLEYAVADDAAIREGDALTTDDEGRIVRATPATDPRRFLGFAAADSAGGRVRVQVRGAVRVPARSRGITADELRARFAALYTQPPLPLP
jgi:hypothetical protein